MRRLVVRIGEGSSEKIIQVSSGIPEFRNSYGEEEYLRRLEGCDYLILIAYDGDKTVGFKVGYDRDGDGSFYSWMGGVIPGYRNKNIAKELALRQQKWAVDHGYRSIKMKTRNKNKAMLIFALSDGFRITGFKEFDNPDESRIMLEKTL